MYLEGDFIIPTFNPGHCFDIKDGIYHENNPVNIYKKHGGNSQRFTLLVDGQICSAHAQEDDMGEFVLGIKDPSMAHEAGQLCIVPKGDERALIFDALDKPIELNQVEIEMN